MCVCSRIAANHSLVRPPCQDIKDVMIQNGSPTSKSSTRLLYWDGTLTFICRMNATSTAKMPSATTATAPTTITTALAVIGQQSPLSSPTSSSYDSDVESPLSSPTENFHQSRSGSHDFIMYRPFPPTNSVAMMADKPIYRIPDYIQQPTPAYFHQEHRYGYNGSNRNSMNHQYIL